MYSLEDVRAEYRRLDGLLGIDSSHIQLKVSPRSVQRLGCFRSPAKPGSGPLSISFSPLIFEDGELFFDTIRHEYAHAAVYLLCPGQRHGHDRLWKEMCLRVGCRPSSRTAAPRVAEERLARARYLLRCKVCGQESSYLRRGKTVELMLRGQGKRLRCKRCGKSDFELYVRK